MASEPLSAGDGGHTEILCTRFILSGLWSGSPSFSYLYTLHPEKGEAVGGPYIDPEVTDENSWSDRCGPLIHHLEVE